MCPTDGEVPLPPLPPLPSLPIVEPAGHEHVCPIIEPIEHLESGDDCATIDAIVDTVVGDSIGI